MQLDLMPYKNALSQLQQSLEYYDSDLARKDSKLALQLRSAAIQAFEYTFELSIRMLKRYLKEFESAETIHTTPFQDLMRKGAEYGFIKTPERWFSFRDMRNITSHTYNESKAQDVFNVIPEFFHEATSLLSNFEAYEKVRCAK